MGIPADDRRHAELSEQTSDAKPLLESIATTIEFYGHQLAAVAPRSFRCGQGVT